MSKNKMQKVDLIFIFGIGIIAIISGLIDIFSGIDFPAYSCMSIQISYVLWIILLIYSSFKYKGKLEKPQYVRWFMGFILPFFHIAFVIFGFIIGIILRKLFNI